MKGIITLEIVMRPETGEPTHISIPIDQKLFESLPKNEKGYVDYEGVAKIWVVGSIKWDSEEEYQDHIKNHKQ